MLMIWVMKNVQILRIYLMAQDEQNFWMCLAKTVNTSPKGNSWNHNCGDRIHQSI